MTILINGYVDFAPGNEHRALEACSDLMAETRTQNGCRAYVWSADPTTPGRLYVYEKWDSEADLAAHLAGDYYTGMLTILGQFDLQGTEVSKFRIDLEEPVYDPEGRPRADFFTG